MGLMNSVTASKKFAKNGIDTPLPAPTPMFTVGSAAATLMYDMECTTDYAFPTINLRVTHDALAKDVKVPISSLIRQITISSPNFKEPLVIEGPALEYLPVAACALLTRLGQAPNFNSLYVDKGFKTGTESEAYLAIPAVLKPGKYQFEVQYSGVTPSETDEQTGEVTEVKIQNRSFRIVGTQRELAQDGLYFCPAAKRVINTVANGQGIGSWKGRYVIVGNPTVGGGIKGEGSDVNVSIRYSDGYMPTNDVIIEGVKFYDRALNPAEDADFPQVYQHPLEFDEITLSRPTPFDVTLVHFFCVN